MSAHRVRGPRSGPDMVRSAYMGFPSLHVIRVENSLEPTFEEGLMCLALAGRVTVHPIPCSRWSCGEGGVYRARVGVLDGDVGGEGEMVEPSAR